MNLNMALALSESDRGFLLGDGVFETLVAENGQVLFAEAHRTRLERACAALGLPCVDLISFHQACLEALDQTGQKQNRAIIRFTLTAGSGGRGLVRPDPLTPYMHVRAFAFRQAPESVRLSLSPIRRNPTSPTAFHKTLNYLDNVLARQMAIDSGADDALMLNGQDVVCCASAANIFWFDGDTLVTPALDCGVLSGITRLRILNMAPNIGIECCEVKSVYHPGLFKDGAFLCNSVMGIVPVVSVDMQSLPRHISLNRLITALAMNNL